MALVVNTNVPSISSQRHLMESRREMETAMERLSSGKRINHRIRRCGWVGYLSAHGVTGSWFEHGNHVMPTMLSHRPRQLRARCLK